MERGGIGLLKSRRFGSEMQVVECRGWVVEMDGGKGRRRRGDALLMGSALACCDPAAAAGPVRGDAARHARLVAKRGRRVILRWRAAGARRRRCPFGALACAVDLAHSQHASAVLIRRPRPPTPPSNPSSRLSTPLPRPPLLFSRLF